MHVMLLVDPRKSRKGRPVTVTDGSRGKKRERVESSHRGPRPIVHGPEDRRIVAFSHILPHERRISFQPGDLERVIRAKEQELAQAILGGAISRSPRYLRNQADYKCVICGKISHKYDSAKHHFIRVHRPFLEE